MDTDELSCDSCGANLPAPDAAGLITCPACGRITRIEVEEKGPSGPQIVINLGDLTENLGAIPPSTWLPDDNGTTSYHPDPDAMKKAASTAGKGCGIAGLVITIVVIGVAIAIVMAVRSGTDAVKRVFESPSNDIVLSGSAVSVGSASPVGGPTVDPADITVVVQDSSGGKLQRHVARLTVSSSGITQRWRSAPISSDASSAQTALLDKTLFAAVEDELYAFDAASGKERWHTTLSDKVGSNCPDCVRSLGGRAIIQTGDGYLTAFTPTSAESVWRLRLNSTQASSTVVAGKLVVIDDGAEGQPTTVTTREPTTGRTIRRFVPRCARDQSSYEMHPNAGDPLIPVPGTSDVMTLFSSGDGCLVRWDATTGVQKSRLVLTGASSIPDDRILVTNRDLVFGVGSNQMVHVDLTTNRGTLLTGSPSDTQALPNRLVGRVLVADTTTTRGTTKGGLAAWDLASGRRIWALATPGGAQATSRNSSDTLFPGSPRSVLVGGARGLSLLVFQGEDHRFTVQAVGIRSGRLGAPVERTYKTRYDSSMPGLTIEAAGPTRILISIDSLLQSIPVPDGPISAYPS